MEIKDISEAIITLFNFSIKEEHEDKIIFSVISDKSAVLYKRNIVRILEELKYYNTDFEIELFNSSFYEVLVREESRVLVRSGEILQTDAINKIEYKIDKPSDKYLIFFLYNLNKQNAPKILRRGIMPFKLRRLFESEDNIDILEVIKEIIPRFQTLQIRSDQVRRKTDFEQLVYAFLFNLGYNLDYTYQILRFMDEFIQPYKIGRLRKANLADLEPPKKLYVNELILHYQKGISTESIDHQYLSFYHVFEHFFEKIYNEDILNSVKNELTKPDFSYKRQKDISVLISVIQNRLKYKNDEFQINEIEALELTLRKFVKDFTYLEEELNTISATLPEYFKTQEVPFSKGNRVNFSNLNYAEIYVNLAKRIYYTRNSIVHSKETEKNKYTPFRDDKDLIIEIYLLRLLAEIVIIESSKEL